MTIRRFQRYLTIPVLDARPVDIENWLASLTVSPVTRSHYLSDLAIFYRWCVAQRILRDSPTNSVEGPIRPRYLPRPTRDDDLAHALEEAPPKMRAILCLAAYAGLRASEVAGLDAQDVDLNAMVILVRQGKGQKDRVVAISSTLAPELARYGMPRSGPVVPTLRGANYKPGSISSMVCAFFKSCGIAASLHMNRHWAATQAYLGTRDIRAVQELLGHSSPTVTALYTRVSGVETRAAVEAITPPLALR